MALREVRKIGDDILRKKCRRIDQIDDKIMILLEDMVETMHHENGVGLAAPQVGILKRAAVLQHGDGPVYKLINPEIIEMDGIVADSEGCLSIPGESGIVKRPKWVKVKALNEKGEEIIVEAEEYLARAFCHEIDHLDGILYIDKVEKDIK
jgi:peptide deformylase